MNRLSRSLRRALALFLALSLLVSAAAFAAEEVRYTKEGQAEFEQQLNAGQITAASFRR